jgi:hypothetical protein
MADYYESEQYEKEKQGITSFGLGKRNLVPSLQKPDQRYMEGLKAYNYKFGDRINSPTGRRPEKDDSFENNHPLKKIKLYKGSNVGIPSDQQVEQGKVERTSLRSERLMSIFSSIQIHNSFRDWSS